MSFWGWGLRLGGRRGGGGGFGPELITNGGFDADTDWTKETGWTISGGTANKTETNTSALVQAVATTLLNSTEYILEYDIIGANSGLLLVRIGGGSVPYNFGSAQSGNGAKTITATTTATAFEANTIRIFSNNSAFEGSIDNVSLKRT